MLFVDQMLADKSQQVINLILFCVQDEGMFDFWGAFLCV